MSEINCGTSARETKGHQEPQVNHQLSKLSASIYKGNRRQKLKKKIESIKA